MKTQFIRILVFITMLAGLVTPITGASAAGPSGPRASSASLAGLLNADGTLRLDGSFQGAVDISGYRVQMDPKRGPVFEPAQLGDNAPLLGGGGGSSDQWSTMGNGTQALNGEVNAIAINGSSIYLGGAFTDAMGIPEADHIVKWDALTGNWSALGNNGAGGGSLNQRVYALAVSGLDLYVGGAFTNVNNGGTVIPEADYVAMWDGSNWSALQSNGAGDGALNDWVLTLATSGTGLYIGGWFTDAHNGILTLSSADYIVQWDGTFFHSVGTGAGNGSLNAKVNVIVTSGSNVFAGGSFVDVNNNGTVIPEADYIAKWDGSNWSALQSNGAGNGALNNDVEALALDDSGNMYVGGSFTDAHNGILPLASADYIARWDGSFWYPLGTGSGNGSLNGTVYSIVVDSSNVYAAGSFTNVNNAGIVLNAADYAARWNVLTGNWSALGSNGAGNGALNMTALKLIKFGPLLYVGGSFTDVNNLGNVMPNADYIAIYDTSVTNAFNSIGSQDGWTLESAETSNKGGSRNAVAATINIGDNALKKQYRGILSFNTGATLPDNAVITSVVLKIKKQSIVGGGNPVTSFQGFMADIKTGVFGLASLQPGDFQSPASGTYGPFKPVPVGGWYSLNLSAGSDKINTLATGSGLTQIRLRFKLDDNNNAVANYLSLFSGNAPLVSRPQLIVQYYLH